MAFENWDEIRTAYHVAKAGTVSGAAEVLGVHHATVIRHIDALEQRLGAKLFQRHARGYTATDAGRQVLQVGQTTEDQLNQLAARITGAADEMTGDLTITALPSLAGLVVPALAALHRDHPGLTLRLLTDTRVFRLEYGEAHVAIRAGSRPTEPDNIVQPFVTLDSALYATPDYVERFGMPQTDADLAGHQFVGFDARAPFMRWLSAQVPAAQIALHVNDVAAKNTALRAGIGVGFCFPSETDSTLVQVMPPRAEWAVPLWLVTHVDLHRTPKVQAALSALKGAC